MNVLACASGFGLGPVGKLASIVAKASMLLKNDISWYACGDEIDMAIFEKDIFEKTCWSRNEKEIKKFIKKYDIKLAIVVLDPDIAIILENNGVNVFFIDSLPFLWTEVDLLPFNASKYFAQKCVRMSKEATNIMKKVKNLIWVNPITYEINDKYVKRIYKVVINLGRNTF